MGWRCAGRWDELCADLDIVLRTREGLKVESVGEPAVLGKI